MSATAKPHRPWRYWGVDLGRDRPRLRLVAFVLFALVCAWSTIAVIVALISAADGSIHSHAARFAVAVALVALIALWTGKRAIRLWRRITAHRRSLPN